MQDMRYPSFREALLFWAKLGFISFGGPAGQIAIMHEFLVEKKRWISPSRFLHALNYCMLLPGPEAQQLATYTGWLLHGVRGGIASGMLFILPSVLILLVLSALYAEYGALTWVASLFYGLKPAIVAIVLLALYRIGTTSLSGIVPIAIALGSFFALSVLHIPFPYIVAGALCAGALVRWLAPEYGRRTATARDTADQAGEYLLDSNTTYPHRIQWKLVVVPLVLGVVLWCIPAVLLSLFAPHPDFWQSLVVFFTKAAFVTFGGAYAVLPYVAQVSVERLGWLTRLQMIDGLALGETTPGPLVMVLAFVGFMSGYNHFGGSVPYGALGLLLTTYYTFLPCFLFIFIGAPLIERTRGEEKLASVLQFVTAAIVGVILNLAVYFGKAVVFPAGFSLSAVDWWSAVWIVISVVALHRLRLNTMLWIAVSAVAGLVWNLLL